MKKRTVRTVWGPALLITALSLAGCAESESPEREPYQEEILETPTQAPVEEAQPTQEAPADKEEPQPVEVQPTEAQPPMEDKPSSESIYAGILQEYRAVQEGADPESLSFHSVLMDEGWPEITVNENVRYLFYDLDSDGMDELFITYCGSIKEIYAYDGEKTVYALGADEFGKIIVHEDGVLEVHIYGVEKNYSVTWYLFDPETAHCFPLCEEQGEEGSDTEYYSYGLTEDVLEEIRTLYRETGNMPVWAYEWAAELTQEEYTGMISAAAVVEMPEGKQFGETAAAGKTSQESGELQTQSGAAEFLSAMDGELADFMEFHSEGIAYQESLALDEQTQYESNIFLSNFAEQHRYDNGVYRLGYDASVYQLVNFAYMNVKINNPSLLRSNSEEYLLSLSDANKVLERFFGMTLTEKEAKQFDTSAPDEREYFDASGFHFVAADGELHMDFAVVREMREAEDGSLEVFFDVYTPTAENFEETDMTQFYHMSTEEVAASSDISHVAQGVAYLIPYQYNDRNSYHMLSVMAKQ